MMIMPDLSDEFRKGQRVDLVSGWKVRFVIASGILEMLKNVVNSNENHRKASNLGFHI